MIPLLTAALHLQLAAAAPAAPRDYRIDTGHSAVEFSIPFLYSQVRGRFDQVRGIIQYDESDPRRSAVMVVIATKSINTGWAHRDEHLRSSDFFDAERYPTIVFRSTRVARGAAGRGAGAATLALTGELTMHGVTRAVTIPVRVTHPTVRDPHGSSIIGFAGSVRLARKDHGILGGSQHNDWFDQTRSATMADSVDVAIEVEGWDTDYDRKHVADHDSAVARIARAGVASLVERLRAAAAADPARFKDAWWDFNELGRTLAARGRDTDALEIMKLNAALHPDLADAEASLAIAYHRVGDTAGARAHFRRALELDPVDPRATLWMARLR